MNEGKEIKLTSEPISNIERARAAAKGGEFYRDVLHHLDKKLSKQGKKGKQYSVYKKYLEEVAEHEETKAEIAHLKTTLFLKVEDMVADMPIPAKTRVLNILKEDRLRTVADVFSKMNENWTGRRNLGPKGLEEIQKFLKESDIPKDFVDILKLKREELESVSYSDIPKLKENKNFRELQELISEAVSRYDNSFKDRCNLEKQNGNYNWRALEINLDTYMRNHGKDKIFNSLCNQVRDFIDDFYGNEMKKFIEKI